MARPEIDRLWRRKMGLWQGDVERKFEVVLVTMRIAARQL